MPDEKKSDCPEWTPELYGRLRDIQLAVLRQVTYSPDRDTWGDRDYWASALDLREARWRGDCVDIALEILRRARDAGHPADCLAVGIVRDRETLQAHAVALADIRAGERRGTLALDSWRYPDDPVPWDRMPLYRWEGRVDRSGAVRYG